MALRGAWTTRRSSASPSGASTAGLCPRDMNRKRPAHRHVKCPCMVIGLCETISVVGSVTSSSVATRLTCGAVGAADRWDRRAESTVWRVIVCRAGRRTGRADSSVESSEDRCRDVVANVW